VKVEVGVSQWVSMVVSMAPHCRVGCVYTLFDVEWLYTCDKNEHRMGKSPFRIDGVVLHASAI